MPEFAEKHARSSSLPPAGFAPPGAQALKRADDGEQEQGRLNDPAGSGHDIGRIPITLAARGGTEPEAVNQETDEERKKKKPEAEDKPQESLAEKKGEDDQGCFQILGSGKVEPGRPAKFPQVFGYTVYDTSQIEKWPSFVWKSTLEKTDALGTSWQAYATPASEKGYKVTADDSTNPVFQKYVLKYPNYNYYVRVSPTAAETIAAAEQQHINDLSEGWEITGEATAKAINEVAKEEPDTRADAVSKVEAKLGKLGNAIHSGLAKGGRLEDSLKPLLDNAARKSKEARDDSKKHDLGLDYVMADDQKLRVLFEVNEDFKLDKTKSSDVVNLKSIVPDETKASGG
jgi:hypothetical protein